MRSIEEVRCRNLIIEQITNEINPNKEWLQRVENRLRKANLDELERLCNAFMRFGVKEIFESVEILR